jgi:hypothetical protein
MLKMAVENLYFVRESYLVPIKHDTMWAVYAERLHKAVDSYKSLTKLIQTTLASVSGASGLSSHNRYFRSCRVTTRFYIQQYTSIMYVTTHDLVIMESRASLECTKSWRIHSPAHQKRLIY